MQVLWFVSRAAGLVALLLMTVTILLGIFAKVRWKASGMPRFVVAHLHRNISLLTVVFLAVHVSTAVIDPYAGIRWVDVVVPFVSGYETFWLGLGVIAIELLATLIVTSLLRTRIGFRTWRAVHWAAYLCWPVAVVHGLGIGGQDTRNPWILSFTVGCVALVAVGLAGRRLAPGTDEPGRIATTPRSR